MLLNGVMILSNIGKQHIIVNAGSVPQKSPGLGNTGVIISNTNDFRLNVSFDWFKLITDKVLYEPEVYTLHWNKILSRGLHDDLLEKVVYMFNHNSKHYSEYELYNGSFNHSGCKFGCDLNEGIRIGLNGARTSNDRPITCFELSGKGCYEFTKNKNYVNLWLKVFDLYLKEDMKSTRLDIAYDFIGGSEVDDFISFIIKKIKAGEVRHKWKDNYYSEIISKNGGYTLYIGSPSSDARIRIYNKNAEKISKDKTAFIDDENYWRLELQLNDENKIKYFIKNYFLAFNNLYYNIDRFRKFLLSFLNEFFEIRDKTDDNISRCPINKRWQSFIENSEGFFLSFGNKEEIRKSTMDIKREWLLSSVSKVFLQCYCSYGENIFYDFLKEMIHVGYNFNDKDKQIIANHLNVLDFSDNDLNEQIEILKVYKDKLRNEK